MDALAVLVVRLLAIPLVAVVLVALDRLEAAVAVIALDALVVLGVDQDAPDAQQDVPQDAKDVILVRVVVQAVDQAVRMDHDPAAQDVVQVVLETATHPVLDVVDVPVVVRVAAQGVVAALDNVKVGLVVSTVVVVNHVPDVWAPAVDASRAQAVWVGVTGLAVMLALVDVVQRVRDARRVVVVQVVPMVEHITAKDVHLDVQQDVDLHVEMAAMEVVPVDVPDAPVVDQDALEGALEAAQISVLDAPVVDLVVQVVVKAAMLVAPANVLLLVVALVQQHVLRIVAEPAMVKQL